MFRIRASGPERWKLGRPLSAVSLAVGLVLAGAAAAEDFAVRAEIAEAQAALDTVFQNLPGMGGLGAIPDRDLAPIQEIADHAERALREAKRQAQALRGTHDEARAVAHARAAKAYALTADELRRKLGH